MVTMHVTVSAITGEWILSIQVFDSLTISSLFNQNELLCQASNGRVRVSGDLMSAPLIRAM